MYLAFLVIFPLRAIASDESKFVSLSQFIDLSINYFLPESSCLQISSIKYDGQYPQHHQAAIVEGLSKITNIHVDATENNQDLYIFEKIMDFSPIIFIKNLFISYDLKSLNAFQRVMALVEKMKISPKDIVFYIDGVVDDDQSRVLENNKEMVKNMFAKFVQVQGIFNSNQHIEKITFVLRKLFFYFDKH